MRKIYIIILLFSLLSCNDKINIVKLDNWAKTGTDYTELYSFLNTAIQNTDYLSSISSSAQTIISTKSGKKFTIKEQCNYFTMNTLGALSHNNKEIAVKLKVRDTWYNAPNLEISSEYRLSINGLKTNIVSSGVNIINCGKFVYFYIEGQVFALKSEINEAFNPPLPKDKSLLKVLFVGNSFNVDATTHLPGILNANGSDRVFMGRVYHGGCTLPMYNTNYDTPKYLSLIHI